MDWAMRLALGRATTLANLRATALEFSQCRIQVGFTHLLEHLEHALDHVKARFDSNMFEQVLHYFLRTYALNCFFTRFINGNHHSG